MAQQAQAALPFPIASRQMMRNSFVLPTVALSAGAQVQTTPTQIPAVGFIRHLMLEVTLTGTGGTTPAFLADAPWNAIAQIELKTSGGSDIIVPITGYQLYLAAKYGAQFQTAPYSDMKLSRQFSATAPSAHFFLPVPLEIDWETALGSIPALASNRNYQLLITFAPISSFLSGAPSVTAQVNCTAYYWSQPTATAGGGVAQSEAPTGIGTLSQWSLEQPPLTPGDKYIRSNNVGSVLRCLIFTLRNASGARIDASGWPAQSELYLDNDPMFQLTQNEWEMNMAATYGFTAASKDVAGGLDTGVYVIPFFAPFGGGTAGETGATRQQYLPTLDASLLQLRGTWGSAASTLEILTNSVTPTSAQVLFSR